MLVLILPLIYLQFAGILEKIEVYREMFMNQVSELTAAPLGDLAKKLNYIMVRKKCGNISLFTSVCALLLKDVIMTSFSCRICTKMCSSVEKNTTKPWEDSVPVDTYLK